MSVRDREAATAIADVLVSGLVAFGWDYSVARGVVSAGACLASTPRDGERVHGGLSGARRVSLDAKATWSGRTSVLVVSLLPSDMRQSARVASTLATLRRVTSSTREGYTITGEIEVDHAIGLNGVVIDRVNGSVGRGTILTGAESDNEIIRLLIVRGAIDVAGNDGIYWTMTALFGSVPDLSNDRLVIVMPENRIVVIERDRGY